MAISNLVTYSSTPNATSISTGRPTFGRIVQPAMATSAVTKKPIAGSITRSPSVAAPQSVGTSQSITGLVKPPMQQTASYQQPQTSVTPPVYYQGKVTDYGRSIGISDAPAQQTKPNTTPSNPIGTAASGLINLGQNNPATSGPALEAYNQAVEAQRKLKSGIAEQYGKIQSDPIPLEFQQGREQALARQYASQLEAGQSAVNQQQAALGYQIQGNQAQQTALSSAAGLVPDALRYEAFGGGGLSPQTRASELAEQVKSGLISPQTAEAQMSSLYGGAGATFLNQALQGGGNFNYNQAAAQSAAQQANIQTQQTTGTNIASQGLAQATTDYMQMNQAAQFAGKQSAAVQDILAKAGLNSASSTDYNKAVNNLKARFGDTDFAALNVALREAQSAYAQLLSTGGNTPTFNDQQAMSVLDINQPASAINAAIEQLDNAVKNRLGSLYSTMQTYQSQLGSSGGSSNDPLGIR